MVVRRLASLSREIRALRGLFSCGSHSGSGMARPACVAGIRPLEGHTSELLHSSYNGTILVRVKKNMTQITSHPKKVGQIADITLCSQYMGLYALSMNAIVPYICIATISIWNPNISFPQIG